MDIELSLRDTKTLQNETAVGKFNHKIWIDSRDWNHFLAKIYKFVSADHRVGTGRRLSTRTYCAAAVGRHLCSVR